MTMNFGRLILRNVQYHARSHLGVFLGTVIGSAIFIGALAVGDSVRGSLREMAMLRLGKIQSSLSSGDRFFREALAPELQTAAGAEVAPALLLYGNVTAAESSSHANGVRVLGVQSPFWRFAEQPAAPTLNEESVALNSHLASHLKVKVGDTILVRVQKPSMLSREMPISPQEDSSVALRVKVAAVVSDEQFGRFSLQANQTPPFNVFIDLHVLQAKLDLKSQANLLLSTADALTLSNAFNKTWQLSDLQIVIHDRNGSTEVSSPRIFIDEPIARAANTVNPSPTRILTYFVNELRNGERATPYSTVTATEPPLVPKEMADDEIIINQWLADDLKLKTADKLSLRYFILGQTRRLEERTNTFRVRGIVPLNGIYADRTLMPEFPGIAKAEKTENWDAGFPINLNAIRPKDEKYWHDYRGTPKAFITIAAGQKVWANRFGDLTALRFPNSPSQQIATSLKQDLNPATVGLIFQPVRKQALASVAGAQDFGELFLSFSFFLIVAALILVALLFQFALEQRSVETGTLLALGFGRKQVRRMLLAESAVIALAGGIVGTLGGILYARAMLHGLGTIWRQAVGTSALHFSVSGRTLAIGLASSVVISTLTIFIVLRKQSKRTARELLAGTTTDSQNNSRARKDRHVAGWLAAICGAAALGLIGWAITQGGKPDPETFFSAGSLLLIALIASCAVSLKKLARSEAAAHLTISSMGLRGATRRKKRSLATISLLASGSFLIVAVSAFHLESDAGNTKKSSGTGGFSFIGETAFPVIQNLNEESGREFFGLNDRMAQNNFVQFRVHAGDDASCLNLNHAQQPRLLGVKPGLLEGRFSFAAKVKETSKTGWHVLETEGNAASEVPAIGDAASVQWALGKKVGDTLDYTDEFGNQFKLRIVATVANSILQGSLVIDEAQFVKRFPSESGYRMFLIDTPSNNRNEFAQSLSRALRDVGLDLTPASERLAAFNAVQNTYLSTFQILGGLGLLLGSGGLGVVVLRNVFERRGELALLSAVGFRKRALRWLVLSEHAGLLLAGLLSGVLAAIAAILPNLTSPSVNVPVRSLALLLGGIFVSGLVWTWLASRITLRAKLLKALRIE